MERRLKPKAEIRDLHRRVWPAEQHGFTGAEYYVDVFNRSESEPLNDVRAELIAVQPDPIGYLPAPLHVKHEDYELREFSVNAGSVRQVDLLTGPTNHAKSQAVMVVAHTVNAERTAIPIRRYTFTVRISAKNTAPALAEFETWVDEEGELRCARSGDR